MTQRLKCAFHKKGLPWMKAAYEKAETTKALMTRRQKNI